MWVKIFNLNRKWNRDGWTYVQCRQFLNWMCLNEHVYHTHFKVISLKILVITNTIYLKYIIMIFHTICQMHLSIYLSSTHTLYMDAYIKSIENIKTTTNISPDIIHLCHTLSLWNWFDLSNGILIELICSLHFNWLFEPKHFHLNANQANSYELNKLFSIVQTSERKRMCERERETISVHTHTYHSMVFNIIVYSYCRRKLVQFWP